jgi:hypothetical protein
MATLDYQRPPSSDRYSRLGIIAICISVAGLAAVIIAGLMLNSAPRRYDNIAKFVVLAYPVCLLLGFILSAVGYFRDDRHKRFCFAAFLVSLVQLIVIFGVAMIGTLMSRK